MRFAVYFGNRGFFPGELIESAIADFRNVLKANGHEALIMEGRGRAMTPSRRRRRARSSPRS